MSTADDDRILNEAGDEGGREEPVFVLPAAGSTTTQGLGSGGGALTGSPILPEPVVSPDEDHAALHNLASRVEQALADDGRFAPLVGGLVIVTDSAGHVTLSGRGPEAVFRPSLLATVHALPGVTGVTDEMSST